MTIAVQSRPAFDVRKVREDFPILKTQVHGKPLIYLDNAATTQKPRPVIDAIVRYYEGQNSNIHRGVHHLSEVATRAYETARVKVQRFLNAADPREIIFTRGATESINLVAHSFVRPGLKAGDEVLITHMEHHSNIVPWQLLRDEKGLVLKVAPIDDRGDLILEEFEKLISPRTKLIAVTHVSNALGTVVPVKKIIAMARARSIPVLLDGAQAVPHSVVDVQALDCDFYCFSAHKMIGPTGFGVLYGRESLLDAMPPWQGGGDMILTVTFEKTTYNQLPWKFEAGTPHIAGAIGLGAAIRYLQGIGMERIAAYGHELLEYATARLACIPGLRIIGTAPQKAAVVSFTMAGIHPHDIGTILDTEGVAVRTGHHCAMPVMDFFEVPATARASLSFYNTFEEIDRLVAALEHARQLLG